MMVDMDIYQRYHILNLAPSISWIDVKHYLIYFEINDNFGLIDERGLNPKRNKALLQLVLLEEI